MPKRVDSISESRKTAHTAPGAVVLREIASQETVTPGGIVIAAPLENKKVLRLRVGWVLGCGKFCDYRGNVHPEMEHFPLPYGTLVEHKNYNPFETADLQLAIKTEDVVRYWLPGDWPDWAIQAQGKEP